MRNVRNFISEIRLIINITFFNKEDFLFIEEDKIMFPYAEFMITPEVTTMRDAAASASLSPPFFPHFAHSPVNPFAESEQRNFITVRASLRMGWTNISSNEWDAVGVTWLRPETHCISWCCQVDVGSIARRRCLEHTRDWASQVWPASSLRIAAPTRRNRPHSPWWRSRVGPSSGAPFHRRVLSRSTWTRKIIPAQTEHSSECEQLGMWGWSIFRLSSYDSRCDQWYYFSAGATEFGVSRLSTSQCAGAIWTANHESLNCQRRRWQ